MCRLGLLFGLAFAICAAANDDGQLVVPLERWVVTPAAGASSPPWEVTVPCTVFGGLLAAGAFEDPFFGLNLDSISSGQFNQPWNYTTTVDANTVSRLRSNQSAVVLQLDGINYRASVYANGQQLQSRDGGQTLLEGAFRHFELDIPQSALWADSKLKLEVVVSPPHDSWKPGSNSTDLSISFIDWNPPPPDASMGLWRPARIVQLSLGSESAPSQPLLRWPVFETELRSNGSALVTLAVDVVLPQQTDDPASSSGQVRCNISGPSGYTSTHVEPVSNIINSTLTFPSFTIEGRDLELWWPWHMLPDASDLPFMYNLTCSAEQSTTDNVRYLASNTILHAQVGVRQIKSMFNSAGYLQLVVNDRPLLVLGGGYTPRLDLKALSFDDAMREMTMIKAMGLNTVRLEGKLPSEEWLHAADVAGMFVMPGLECCDAWQHWKSWTGDVLEVARSSVATMARQLRSHPAMLIFAYSSDELPPAFVEAAYLEEFALARWPNPVLASCSNLTSQLTGLQTGVKMSGPYNWVPPDYWYLSTPSIVPVGSDSPLGGAFGFLTEGGPGASPMVPRSWESTVPLSVASQWPPNETSQQYWDAHCANPAGLFGNLQHFTDALFLRYGRAATNTTARNFLLAGQVASYETRRAMLEAYCRNKHSSATGLIMWLLNSAHPSHMWNLFDFYGRPSGSVHGPMRATEHYRNDDALQAIFAYDDRGVYILTGPRFKKSFVSANFTLAVSVFSPNGTQLSRDEKVIDNRDLQADDALLVDHVQYPQAQVAFFVEITLVTPKSTDGEAVAGGASLVDRAVYWLATEEDDLDWDNSNFYTTPVKRFADFSPLTAGACNLTALEWTPKISDTGLVSVNMQTDKSKGCVYFGMLWEVVVAHSEEGTSRYGDEFVFTDNIVTLFPGQTLTLTAHFVPGRNSEQRHGVPQEVCVSTFTGEDGAPICKQLSNSTVA